MNWRKWKIGLLVSFLTGLCSGALALAADLGWRAIVFVFVTNIAKDCLLFLKSHPSDQISFDTARLQKSPAVPTSQPSGGVTSALVIGLASALLFAGCATQNTSGRLLVSTAQTVDAAMKGWAYYAAVANVPKERVAAVGRAYDRYQLAMSAAEQSYIVAVKSGDTNAFTLASNALRAAQTDLLALIQTFSKNPPATGPPTP